MNCTKHVKNGKEDFIQEYCNRGQDIAYKREVEFNSERKKRRLEAFKCWVKLSGKVLRNVRREPWLMRLCHLYLPVVPYQLCSHPLTETRRQGINLL